MSSVSEAMVLNRKRWNAFSVLGDSVPQVEEFEYLDVLFTSDGNMEGDE